MYQVVASDLDGTLLSPDHTLSPYAKETLKLLTARGIHFVLCHWSSSCRCRANPR
ncbi:putative hydrolase of the HAD superfamily [Salmonella enterica subsp. enterica]|uniref:Putative hydrolase of the HAD superfamily n=1 Tax=Salmonella enterica I TaxID=59201 RepID=A0A379X4R5_SALET|nr:putative hydrolase of the HAD superfamily [Salmonella enterica subsp. enterica]